MEEKTVYVAQEKEFSIAVSYTVTLKHVGMVSDLVARGVAKNASEAARMLIEAGYAVINQQAEEKPA
jgi:hypothetical protein